MITVRKTESRRIENKIDVKNKDEEATIYFYGDIGGMFGIDTNEWIKEFNNIKAKTIHWRVASGGGDIFAAREIKTAVMQHPAKVIAHVDSIAASAMSFAITGADEIEIVDGGFIMIHNAMSFLDILGYFNIKAIDELIESLVKEKELQQKINKSIADDYSKITGREQSEYLTMMDNETWFTAKEALEIGLVDRIYDGNIVEAKYDLSIYNKVPESIAKIAKTLKNIHKELNERELERDLRDAKYSRNQAKEIVAKVFHNERDARSEPDTQDVRDAQNDAGSTLANVEPPKKKDRTADLLTRAEMIAPNKL